MTDESTDPEAQVAKSAPVDRAEQGPLDDAEANQVRPYGTPTTLARAPSTSPMRRASSRVVGVPYRPWL